MDSTKRLVIASVANQLRLHAVKRDNLEHFTIFTYRDF